MLQMWHLSKVQDIQYVNHSSTFTPEPLVALIAARPVAKDKKKKSLVIIDWQGVKGAVVHAPVAEKNLSSASFVRIL